MDKFIVRDIENLSKIRVLDKYLVGHKGFVAGGCFKNIFSDERVKDIDLFFNSELDFNEARNWFRDDEDYIDHYENPKVVSYKNTKTGVSVELIRTIFGSPEKIIDSFDFTITKFAYYKEEVKDEDDEFGEDSRIEEKVMHHKDFFEHLFFKRLVIEDELKFPISTFERSLRYKGYGYSLCRESKARLIDCIRNTENENNISQSLYDGMD
jgi:hypothetical protein